MSLFGKQYRYCPNCGVRLYDGKLTNTHVKELMCSAKCRDEWQWKYTNMVLGVSALEDNADN